MPSTEEALYSVLHEELHIGLKDIEIRERLLVMAEVSGVIPNVKHGRDRLPGDNIVAEAAILLGISFWVLKIDLGQGWLAEAVSVA